MGEVNSIQWPPVPALEIPGYLEAPRNRVFFAWREITLALETYPTEPSPGSVTDYRPIDTNKTFGSLGFTKFIDGMCVTCTAKGSLENLSHNFVFPTDSTLDTPGSDLSYHREPFDVDPQSLGSATVDLTGVDAIANDGVAMWQLLTVREQIEMASRTGWVGLKTIIQ
jgi:hypothetical protein